MSHEQHGLRQSRTDWQQAAGKHMIDERADAEFSPAVREVRCSPPSCVHLVTLSPVLPRQTPERRSFCHVRRGVIWCGRCMRRRLKGPVPVRASMGIEL